MIASFICPDPGLEHELLGGVHHLDIELVSA
jgi:hypothetical protein